MGMYEQLGVRRVINADATLTRLGGSLMPSDVLDAMREAAVALSTCTSCSRSWGNGLPS